MGDRISIAAALRRVKRLKGQIAEHTTRAAAGACYVLGKEPAFSFDDSVKSRGKLVDELLGIEVAVAEKNAGATLPSGKSVLYAIRKLAELRSEMAFYRALSVRAKPSDVDVEESNEYDIHVEKYVSKKKETTHVSAITQARRAEVVDELQVAFEELNAELESFNHAAIVEV